MPFGGHTWQLLCAPEGPCRDAERHACDAPDGGNDELAQYQPHELRQDTGTLWENWLISERKKWLHYRNIHANTFFWRTQDQQEIDFVEERDGHFWAYEMKWNALRKVKLPPAWKKAYPESSFEVISPDTYLNWIC